MNFRLFIYSAVIAIGISHKTFGHYLREEPFYSYGLCGGVSYFKNPYREEGFTKKFDSDFDKKLVRSSSFTPFAKLFAEVRLYKQTLGIDLDVSYINRRHGHYSEINNTGTIFDLHCVDFAILFAAIVEGYGSITFYAGPKLYYIFSTYAKNYDMKTSTEIEEFGDNDDMFFKKKWGGVFGIRWEIDKTGFILGAEVDMFFSSLTPHKYISINPDLVEETERASLADRTYSFGFRMFVGYDFGRLHAEAYN